MPRALDRSPGDGRLDMSRRPDPVCSRARPGLPTERLPRVVGANFLPPPSPFILRSLSNRSSSVLARRGRRVSACWAAPNRWTTLHALPSAQARSSCGGDCQDVRASRRPCLLLAGTHRPVDTPGGVRDYLRHREGPARLSLGAYKVGRHSKPDRTAPVCPAAVAECRDKSLEWPIVAGSEDAVARPVPRAGGGSCPNGLA